MISFSHFTGVNVFLPVREGWSHNSQAGRTSRERVSGQEAVVATAVSASVVHFAKRCSEWIGDWIDWISRAARYSRRLIRDGRRTHRIAEHRWVCLILPLVVATSLWT